MTNVQIYSAGNKSATIILAKHFFTWIRLESTDIKETRFILQLSGDKSSLLLTFLTERPKLRKQRLSVGIEYVSPVRK